MGFAIYFDSAHSLLRISYDGTLTEALVLHAIREVEHFQRDHSVEIGLLDFTRVSSFHLSTEFIRQLATGRAHYKRYFLVAPQDVQYGLSRLFQALATADATVEVTRTMIEVYDTLGIDVSDAVLVSKSESVPNC